MDFKQAGERFAYLKAGLEAGHLSESDFKSRLQDLMVRDDDGQWWMLGYETERWYRYDGANWVPADPPIATAAPASQPAILQEPVPLPASSTSAAGARSLHAAPPAPAAPAIQSHEHKQSAGPSWTAALWIALAWFVAGLLSDWLYGGALTGMLTAAVGGLLTALILRSQSVFRQPISLLWFSLASVPAGLVANALYLSWGINTLLAGALAGIFSALVLRSDGPPLDKLAVSRIIISGAAGWLFSWLVYAASGSSVLGAALGGLAAGLVLIWALRGTSPARPSSRP
jgi:hypothetical protein